VRLLCTLLALGLPMVAHAGAWIQPKGQGLAIAQTTFYTTSHYFDVDGQKQSQLRFTKYELQPYLEYGLTDSITLGGSAYLDTVVQANEEHRGITDPQFFLRGRVYHDDRQVVSIEPLIKLPSHFSESTPPQGGSKSTDLELSLRYGRSQPLLTPHDYTDFRLGYRQRSLGLSDQLLIDAAVGIKYTAWEFTPALRATLATSSPDTVTFSENGELDYSLLKAEFGVLYHLNSDQALQATLFNHVSGVQTGSGYGISLALAQRF